MSTIKDIYEFIDRAERSRKYPVSTAQGLKAAVKIFESELNEEERGSLDTFKQNIEQIYQSVFSKNKNLTASSLATYKSRVLKVIADYEKYGIDPTKMSNWTPKVVTRTKRSEKKAEVPDSSAGMASNGTGAGEVAVPDGMHKIELSLRPNTKFVLIVPHDLKKTEVATINTILGSLAVNEGGNDSTQLPEVPTE